MLVKCKSCEKEIAKGVKKCVNCGADQRNFAGRHKILTGILVLFAIGVISSMGNKGGTTGSVANTSTTGTKTPASTTASTPATPATASTAAPKKTASYQSILDTYSAKIKAATPKLIEEYNNEAAKNTSGVEGLATLSNAKISKLAEISTEGISEMAKIALLTGSGKYSEYQEWALKLTDVYMAEGKKITDAYMTSAMK